MKLNKKSTLFVLPLTALLAACGGSPTSASSATGLSSSAASQPSVASSSEAESSSADPSSSVLSSDAEFPDNIEVDFWSTGSQGMTTQLQLIAEDFETKVKEATGKTVHVNVTVEGSYDTIADKINKGLSVGNVPTMAVAYPDTVANILNQEAGKPYLFDITPYMSDSQIGFGKQSYLGDKTAYNKRDIVGSFLDEGTHYAREGMFSFPFMKSSEVMFYNVDDVERAYQFYKPSVLGKDNIRADLNEMDWDEFENLLGVVAEHKAEILNTLETSCWYDSDSNWIITQMEQRGIPYTSIKDGKGSIDFKDGDARTEVEDMVTHFKSLYEGGLITTKGIENTYGSNAFTNGEVLFEIGSSGGTGYNMPEGVDASKIGVVTIPAANGNKKYVSQGPTITFLRNPTLRDAENEAKMFYAWQFTKYLTNPETNVRLCIRGSEGYIPIRYSAYEDANFQEFLEDDTLTAASSKVLINEIQSEYYTNAVFPGSAQLRDNMGGVIPYVLKGEKTAHQAIQDAIDNASTYMK